MTEPAVSADPQSERDLIGLAILNAERFHECEALEPEHFSEGLLGEMWRVIGSLVNAQRAVDPLSVHHPLAEHPAMIDAGGVGYIASLVVQAPTFGYPPSYAERIISLSIGRDIAAASAQTMTEAHDPTLSGAAKIEAAEARLYAIADRRSPTHAVIPIAEAMREAMATAGEAFQAQAGLVGLSTGLANLDARLGGLRPANLIILGARPSMGKTALGAQIARHVAQHGRPALLFSLEMSRAEIALRLACERAGVASDLVSKGAAHARQFAEVRDAAEAISATPLHIDETPAMRVSQIRTRARRLKRTKGLGLIVVDYLQLMAPDSPRRNGNRVEDLGEITAGLKAIAKELSVPIIALAQLSRKLEERNDQRPKLSDLRESGSIEQDADAVMFLYREAYYVARSEPKEGSSGRLEWEEKRDAAAGGAEIIIGKNRHGQVGTAFLHFDEALMRFSDRADERRYATEPSPRYAYGGAR